MNFVKKYPSYLEKFNKFMQGLARTISSWFKRNKGDVEIIDPTPASGYLQSPQFKANSPF
jgi:hypothetical protein